MTKEGECSIPDSNPVSRRAFLKTAAVAGVASTALANQEAKKIKVGVIGCGSVSGSYLPVMVASPCIELVSACDLIIQRAEERAKKFSIPNVYPNIDEMLKGPKFDFLVNLTSMPSHYPVNLKGLQAGLNVWWEKPLSVHAADAKKLVALATEKKLGFWGAPITILSPQFKFMAETLASGKLGKVTAAHAHYGHEGFLWSAWFFQKGGGSLYDLGVYNVTSLTGLLGPVKSVVGMTSICTPMRKLTDGTEVKVEVSDNDMLIMEHANGVLSHVQSGYNYGSADGHSGRTDQYSIDF
jgi:predicted dehydrogenase